MASKIFMSSPNMKHVAFSVESRPPPPPPHHYSCSSNKSFGQVCLPKRSETTTSSSSCSPSKSSQEAVVMAPSSSSKAAHAAKLVARTTTSMLAHFWREVQGFNNWENLIDPLNPLLQQEIIRYGEFVTACYKAFDLEPTSKRYLNCKYGKKTLFKQVGMDNSGYEVTKYIYATPDINIPIQNGTSCGRWIGYVAVSSDDSVRKLGRRDIVVTFRGTVTNPEWIANFMSSLTPARLDPHDPRPDVKVESGFLSLYTSNESDNKFGLGSCREQLLSEVSRLVNKYKNEDLSITLAGHSMGSSLAILLAYDISELGLNTRTSTDSSSSSSSSQEEEEEVVPVTVFSYGGPRVGNSGFKKRCEELGVKVLRVVNVNDPITKLPGVVFNENFRVLGGRFEFPWSCSCYAHVGVELVLDFFNMQNPSCVHDLETYINLVRCTSSYNYGVEKIQRDGLDFLSKAKDLLSLSAQNLNRFPWKNNVKGNMMMNLVQSQRTY